MSQIEARHIVHRVGSWSALTPGSRLLTVALGLSAGIWGASDADTAAGSRPDPDFRHCSIEIDRSCGQVVWKIDDKILFVAAGLTGLPEELHLGFGIFTVVPLGEGRSSCHGQGARASWRNFEYSLPA